MSSGHEVALAFEWLYSTLSGDATLSSLAPGGVYRALAPPQLTTTPYVIFGFMSGTDTVTMNAYRIMAELTMQVKAVGPASSVAGVYQAAEQIDVLIGLVRTYTNLPAGYSLSCWRQSPLEVDELVDGELWTNCGGLYRIQIEQTS